MVNFLLCSDNILSWIVLKAISCILAKDSQFGVSLFVFFCLILRVFSATCLPDLGPVRRRPAVKLYAEKIASFIKILLYTIIPSHWLRRVSTTLTKSLVFLLSK